MSKDTKTLDNFEGFESHSDIDFFGENSIEETTSEDVLQKVVKDKVIDEEAESSAEKVEKLPEIDFFGESSEGGKESGLAVNTDIGDDAVVEEVKNTSSKLSAYEILKQKGIIKHELEEGKVLSEEEADEIIEDSYEESVEERVSEIMGELPDEVKNIVKYAMNGGDINGLLSKMVSSPTVKITKDLDLENETNQEMVIRTAKKEQGDDNDTIDTYIQFLKDSGKLKDIAGKEHSKIVAKQGKLAEQEAVSVAARKAEAKENHRKFKNELSNFINETDVVAGKLTVNKQDKKELPSYIADRNVKLADGRQVTGMQSALYEALNDKEKTVILAKLLKNNFDFSEISKEEKTKFTREVKRDLSRSEKITPAIGSSQTVKKSLADFFND